MMTAIPQNILEQRTQLSARDWGNFTKHIKDPVRYKLPPKASGFKETIASLYQNIDVIEACALLRMGLSTRPKCKCGSDLIFKLDTYDYTKYCRSCRKVNDIACSKAIIVNGVQYDNIKRAMTELHIHRFDIRKNLLSNAAGWGFAENHENQCKEMIQAINPAFLDKQILLSAKEHRVPIKELMSQYGVKCYATMGLVYAYHNMDTTYDQIPQVTTECLNNKEQFIEAFENSNSEELAVQWNCSPSKILAIAHSYGINVAKRQQSAIERTIAQFIRDISPTTTILERDYSAIGSELDIYVPTSNFAIEFDGLFYHTDKPPFTTKNKHIEKSVKCAERGITLLRFTDIGETKNKLDIVKSIVQHKLGKSVKISARKCKICEISTQEARKFSEMTHISGHSNASVYLGLFHNTELVMMMSFAKPRFSAIANWEIIRMSSKLDHTVVGGASKLLSHFRKNWGGSIMTYANLRFGNGAGYKQLGFEFVRNTGAGYFYTDMQTIFSRHKFQKSVIEKICPVYDPTLSEVENAWNNGFKRYRDCGNAVFLLS